MSSSPINGGYSSAAYPAPQFGTNAPAHRYNGGSSQDRFETQKDKSGFLKKTLKVAGLFVNALALKRYCFSPATVEKIAKHIPGLIKSPFNAIAETGIAKTVTGWGEKLLNLNESLWGKVYSKIGGEKGSQTYQQALNTMKEQGIMGLFSKATG